MPFSAHLAAVHLALLAPIYETENVRIAIEDSTEHHPGDTIAPVRQQLKAVFQTKKLTDWMDGGTPREERLPKGALTIRKVASRELKLGKVDVVIMNPPFTSNDNLPADYKDDLEKRFAFPSAYRKCITGKLSFQAYFLLLADRFLKEGGRVAAVVPLNTFVGKAFNQLTEFFIASYTVQYIIYGKGRAAFSDNTALTEILIVARKQKPKPEHNFALIGVEKSPTLWSDEEVESLSDIIAKSARKGKETTSSLCSIKFFPQQMLSQQEEGLAALVTQMDSSFVGVQRTIDEIYQKSKIMGTFEELEKVLHCEIFAYELRIKGGDYYGYSALSICDSMERMKKKSDVFLFQGKKQKVVQIKNRFTNEIHELSEDHLCQQLRRLSGISNPNITELHEYVIAKYFNGVDSLLSSVYNQSDVEKLKIRIKDDWERKIQKGKSCIVLARRIDIAAPGTRVLAAYSDELFFIAANAWGIRNVSREDAKILTLWFNSSLFLLDFLSKRAPTRGTWGQLDERYLLRIPVIKLNLLTKEQKLMLLDTFDKVSTIHFPSLISQLQDNSEGRILIDRTLLKVLGVKEELRERIIVELYSSLAKKILALKETMRY